MKILGIAAALAMFASASNAALVDFDDTPGAVEGLLLINLKLVPASSSSTRQRAPGSHSADLRERRSLRMILSMRRKV